MSEQKIIPLKIHPVDVTPVPNILIRSPLFGVRQKGVESEYIKTTYYGSQNSYVEFKGHPFTQDDFDVLILLIKKSEENGGIGSRVKFNPGQMLEELGRKDGTNNRIVLINSIERMLEATLSIYSSKTSLMEKSHLVDGFAFYDLRDEKEVAKRKADKKYKADPNAQYVRLGHGAAILFETTVQGSSYFYLEERIKLSRQLTKWLHAFYSTHQDSTCIFLTVDQIKTLSGVSVSSQKNLIAALKQSFAELKEKLNWSLRIISEGKNKGRIEIIKGKVKQEKLEQSLVEPQTTPPQPIQLEKPADLQAWVPPVAVESKPPVVKHEKQLAGWEQAKIQQARKERSRLVL